MPCQYDESAEEIEKRQKASKRALIQPYKKELDLVTRLLCEVMTLDDNQDLSPLQFCEAIGNIDELQVWWKEHKQMDERREINERAEARQKALKKLTDKEKRLLGLTK